MDASPPYALVREALILSAALSLPVLAAAAIIGLIVAALQSATSVQDAALAHLPKLVVVVVALVITGPWMARTLVAFAMRAFGG